MIGRNKRHGFVKVRDLFLLAVIAACLAFVVFYQKNRFDNMEFRPEIYRQRIELPPSQVLKFVTLGYDNLYADWLWLQSIQFFGSGWQTEDNTTKPIYQYFDTMTDLDPHFISAYRFANLIIGDQRNDHVLGQQILRKGVHKNPTNHDLPYLGIYNAIWATNNADDARWFAHRLNRIPTAPSFMKRMEEYIERKSGRFDIAFEFNVRYYLEYLAANNTIERDIAQRRMQDLLERLYQSKFKEAVEKYIEANGEHPERIENLLNPRYLEPYRGPTINSFVNALARYEDEIDRLSPDEPIPEDLVDKVVEAAQVNIVGLPPEPYGTWYFIATPAREMYVGSEEFDLAKFEQVPYIWSGREAVDRTNQVAISAQREILRYYQENEEKPTVDDLKGYLGRDPLGGHYVYERDPEDPELQKYGVFYSTGARRFSEGDEPRMGVAGPGPFPFGLEPRLADRPEEFEWGVAEGFVLPDGSEIWRRASDALPDPEPEQPETGETSAEPAEES